MSTNYTTTPDDLRKALEMLNVYNHTISLYAPVLPLDELSTAYFNSLPKAKWMNVFRIKNYNYGSISQYDNKLRICFGGIFTNVWNFMDGMRLGFDSSFYGIPFCTAQTIARIYASLHYKIQNALLINPNIDTIQLIGHSYGTAIIQPLAILIEKLILFHKDEISEVGRSSINAIYSNYFATFVSELIAANPFDPLSKELSGRLMQGEKNTSFANLMLQIDRVLFNRVKLESVHAFAPVHVMPEAILDDPDLRIHKTLSDINLGTPDPNDFLNRISCYIIPNDPIPGVFDARTLTGKCVQYVFGGGISRILLGRIVELESSDWLPDHEYNKYASSITKSLNNHKKLNIYTYALMPLYQPVPFLIIPIYSLMYVRSGVTIMSIVVAVVGFTISILIPLFFVLIGYFFVKAILWFRNPHE